jgi:DNA-binding protein HU-beta
MDASTAAVQEVEDMAKGLGKGDIAARVSAQLKGTRSEGDRALNAVLDAVTNALKEGKSVTLTGFGTFDVRQVKARKVRALRGKQAGQMMTVAAHKRPGFKPGMELRRAVTGRR